jgi:multimeric flavodoxin WrbA
MEPVTVLGISGSPHRHGNTETLLDAFLEGAKEAGGAVEKIILKGMDYAPCQGCNACHKDGVCIIGDPLIPLFDRILATDIVALASPIYTMGITAEMKGFVDRAQYLWAQKYILKTRYYTREHLRRHKGIRNHPTALSEAREKGRMAVEEIARLKEGGGSPPGKGSYPGEGRKVAMAEGKKEK